MRDRFYEFFLQNPDLVFEQDSTGEICIMPPAGAESSSKNLEIARQLANWSILNGGQAFESSAMFVLANGAKRSPDAAWISPNRWALVPADERKKFPPIAPDFVIELRSETDRLASLVEKMQEYVDQGVQLGWLIDPARKEVRIYRPNQASIVLDQPEFVSGEEVLPGFILETLRLFR
jgi:Uma2 family endonuclease